MATDNESLCFICENIVRDEQDDSSFSVGEEGLFCDGFHKRWVHARCLNIYINCYRIVTVFLGSALTA